MKVSRHKKFQKHLNFFKKHFDWKPPFSVLVDGTFAKAALENKINLREQLPKYFDSEVRLWTTVCCLIETEQLGPDLYGTVQILKSLTIRKCPHSQKPVGGVKCIKEMIRGETRLIPATQDAELWKYFRKVGGIPIIHLNGPAPVFEKPSKMTQDLAQVKNVKKMEVLDYQKEMLDKMKEEAFGETEPREKKGTKKRKRKGPNPLSCKKRKKNDPAQSRPSGDKAVPQKKKRKRVRVKVPKHVKEEVRRVKRQQTRSSTATGPS